MFVLIPPKEFPNSRFQVLCLCYKIVTTNIATRRSNTIAIIIVYKRRIQSVNIHFYSNLLKCMHMKYWYFQMVVFSSGHIIKLVSLLYQNKNTISANVPQ